MTEITRAIEALELATRYTIGGETHARGHFPNLAGYFSGIAHELSNALAALREISKPATREQIIAMTGRDFATEAFREGFRACERRIGIGVK